MNTEKEIKMSLDLAKQMLGKDEAMDMLIKQNFSDEELGIKPKLPKKWEDIEEIKGFYIDKGFSIECLGRSLPMKQYRNIVPTKELAKAILALCQLLYLRDIYNDGWEANWSDASWKHSINREKNTLIKGFHIDLARPMTFKSPELCDEFMTNFKDLLEIAKPLL